MTNPYAYVGVVDIKRREITVDSIVNDVCQEYGVNFLDLITPCRKRELIEPRHVIMYVLKTFKLLSFEQIGQLFNRDHSTVVHARKAVENQRFADKNYEIRIVKLIQKIGYDN